MEFLVIGMVFWGLGMILRWTYREIKPETEEQRNLATSVSILIMLTGWVIFAVIIEYVNQL